MDVNGNLNATPNGSKTEEFNPKEVFRKIFEPLPIGTKLKIKGKTKIWKGVWEVSNVYLGTKGYLYGLERIDLGRKWSYCISIDEIAEILDRGETNAN